MTFTSIQRNMRGFNYQHDWYSVNDFWEGMKHQRDNENDEVEWAKCFNEMGTEVAEYRRGYEIPRQEMK